MTVKKYAIVCSLLIVLGLSGCARIDDFLESQMLQASGIAENREYMGAQADRESGKLDSEYYYAWDTGETDPSSVDRPPQTAHIAFAINSNLEASYYSDPGFSNALNLNNCNLSQGDRIYAKVEVRDSAVSSAYEFLGFYLYKYTPQGERKKITTITPGENGLVLEISKDHIESDLSIEPIGTYKACSITLQDYYTDDDGGKHDLSGAWLVDDRQCDGKSIEINPITSHLVSYHYDSNEYFYFDSDPQCFYNNNADGNVIFARREKEDTTTDYSVELRKYVIVTVVTMQGRTVTVNSEESQTIKAGNKLAIPKLKYGDSITIQTDKEWPELVNSEELIEQSTENLGTGYKYVLTVPEKGGEFEFNPAEYTYDHGTIVFKCRGEEVKATRSLAKGTKIVYEAGDHDPEYQLADGDHVIVVGDAESTRQKLKDIEFVKSVKVAVTLEQPEFGGKIKYIGPDKKEITTKTYHTTSGTEIKINFESWEGWINRYTNDCSYKVTEAPSQTAKLSATAADINSAFYEDEEHKPELEIVLDKSVGERMKFAFSASGLSEKDLSYNGNFLQSTRTVVEPQKIGTEKGIQIAMEGRALQSGTAIKILVEKEGTIGDKTKKGTKKIKTSDCLLITDLTKLLEPIPIYTESEPGTSPVWYKSIQITISVVDILEFTEPKHPENMSVVVRNADTQKILKSGEILEGDTKVSVTISAC